MVKSYVLLMVKAQTLGMAQSQYRSCSSRRKIREKRREDALLATSNIARLVTKSTGNKISAEITNNSIIDDIRIVKQQV